MLKTKQSAPLLPKRVNNQRRKKESNRNPNRNLNHPQSQTGKRQTLARTNIATVPRSMQTISHLIRIFQPSDQRATRCQPRGHQDKYPW